MTEGAEQKRASEGKATQRSKQIIRTHGRCATPVKSFQLLVTKRLVLPKPMSEFFPLIESTCTVMEAQRGNKSSGQGERAHHTHPCGWLFRGQLGKR